MLESLLLLVLLLLPQLGRGGLRLANQQQVRGEGCCYGNCRGSCADTLSHPPALLSNLGPAQKLCVMPVGMVCRCCHCFQGQR
jgi:hypothetical protein